MEQRIIRNIQIYGLFVLSAVSKNEWISYTFLILAAFIIFREIIKEEKNENI